MLRRRPLPLIGGGHTHELRKCADACHNACQHEPGNTTDNPAFADIAARHLSRRSVLKAGAASAVAAGLATVPLAGAAAAEQGGEALTPQEVVRLRKRPGGTLGYTPIEPNIEAEVVVPDGYTSRLVMAWGDPLFSDAPDFDYDDPQARTAEAHDRWFGYNCDYVAFFPLRGSALRRGLLWVNHEYFDSGWSGGGIETLTARADAAAASGDTAREARLREAIALASQSAMGGSVVEVRRGNGTDRSYHPVVDSDYNRRITPRTPMHLAGPVGGTAWVQDSLDAHGTIGNCAGGQTPWGTVLTAEENFVGYFTSTLFSEDDLATELGFKMLVDGALVDATVGAVHARYGVDGEGEGWEYADARWGDAYEPFRFGYVVEIDPHDPHATPKKRTAMGRMKHEGAATIIAKTGEAVAYMGDDERFDYLYKFVSKRTYQPGPGNELENADLFDEGTIYVAVFEEEDTDVATGAHGRWIPLVPGTMTTTGKTLHQLGWDEAAIAAFTRGAADLVGATKMDRPEDVQMNPVNNRVYVMCTNNSEREDPNDPNPRGPNTYGHVIEITEWADNAASTSFSWVIPLAGGEPDVAYEDGGLYTVYEGGDIVPMSSPDNCTFDMNGNLWIATDGRQPLLVDGVPSNDGFFSMPVDGRDRGNLQLFATVPIGAECCGPYITPDGATLFLAVQHPDAPWPDGGSTGYGRPGVVSIWKTGGGRPQIGT